MKKVLSIIICFVGINVFSQINLIGYSQPVCAQPMTNVYTYSNSTSGMGSGTTYGFTVYRNGSSIYGAGGSGSGGRKCHGIAFINDSTGFITDRQFSGGVNVFKTQDYGATWTMVGQGGPSFMGLYPVNANYAYLITSAANPFVEVSRCSDIESPQNQFILDQQINSDIYTMDAACHNSLCNIDSLDIMIKNGADTITYHINSFLPLMTKPVNGNNCSGSMINVPFNANATFNSGNIFTAQLSDASGSFAAPVNIGSLASISSGTINAIIPSGTTPGTGYKIRVVSTDPVYNGTHNGAKISIYSPTQTLSFTGTNPCAGSTATINASGAFSYTWSTGSTYSSITLAPGTPTCSVIGTNACGTSSAIVNVIPDNTCQYVWPGDANSDGVADNLDILELGLHYTQAGPPRAATNNNWQSYFANNWTGTITTGKNLNHSDCNGDGIINDDDTLAIYNNYSLTHAFRTSEQNSVNPQLTIVAGQDSVERGKWSSASIYLGDASNPVNNINGLAYTINYDYSLMQTDSVYLEYPVSFINSSNQNLNFRKTGTIGRLFTATTHTNNINVSGFGKIATLHFKLVDYFSWNFDSYLSLSSAMQSTSSGTLTPLTTGSTTFTAIGSLVGIKEISAPVSIALMPNPTSGLIIINSSDELQKIEVTTVEGQLLLSKPSSGKKEELQLGQYSNGVYFIKVTLPDGRNTVKKVVVNH